AEKRERQRVELGKVDQNLARQGKAQAEAYFLMKPDKNVDQLPIFLRVHSVKVSKVPKKPRKRQAGEETAKIPRWPEYALIFDTETRTTVDQTLMFGIYRICKLVDRKYLCEREG